MNRIAIIFIVIGIGVALFATLLVMRGTEQANLASQKIKLAGGQISMFQYCSHIGKAAIDDPNWQEFNMLYSPQK
jgi:hypothetical protein